MIVASSKANTHSQVFLESVSNSYRIVYIFRILLIMKLFKTFRVVVEKYPVYTS